jgi:hypothetical protein
MKITVLPIKWFALIQSDVLIDVIKKDDIRKKTDGADECKIICEGFSIIALGATTFKDIEWNSLLEWGTRVRRQDVLKVSRS